MSKKKTTATRQVSPIPEAVQSKQQRLSSFPTYTPDVTAIMRCGDNDDDPGGYFEYSVAGVSGGQITWGWDTNNNLKCTDVEIRLRLVPGMGIYLKCGGEYELHDDVSTWNPICKAWIYVSVSNTSNYGVKFTATDYNDPLSPNVIVATGLSTDRNSQQIFFDQKPVYDNDSSGFTSVDFTGKISMVGPASITPNAVVAKIFLFRATPSVQQSVSDDPRKNLPDVYCPPIYRDPVTGILRHPKYLSKQLR